MFEAKLMEVGNALVQGCREGHEMENLSVIYDQQCLSLEAASMPGGMDREFKGIDAIKAKHEWWAANNEIHEQKVEGPFFCGENKFSAIFDLDVTNKEMNQRMQMREVALYTVENGKIIQEEFFMAPPQM